MNREMGLANFWAQGDAITHTVAIVLLLLSVASWYVMVSKAYSLWLSRRCHARALASFWGAPSLPAAIEAIRNEDKTGIFASLAIAGANSAELYRQHSDRGIGAGVSASEFVTRSVRSQIVEAQAKIESGLTFLASVGSTAPFIGLFGTVWGIYHALVGLSGASQVVLDKVAGPVGEALIMTAAGLFVAIPAVLAYNAFTRGNRLTLARLDGFAHDLHAYLTTGLRGRPGDKLVDIVAVRAGLRNIPLLGALFSTTNNTRARTELLVMLTPRVLTDDSTLREVSAELRDRMRNLTTQTSLSPLPALEPGHQSAPAPALVAPR